MRTLAVFFLVILTAAPLAAQGALTQARWMKHLKEDLIPFWTTPDAFGDPVGMFPSMRCNDGRAFDAAAPCPEIASNKWMTPDQTFIIALSRQAFAYLVMFHMTGKQQYLDLGKAGVDIILNEARDDLGGTYEGYDALTGEWWHEEARFTIQKQSYALLAPAFYYYLTRDRAVFGEIEEIRQTILDLHRLEEDGLYAWTRKGEVEARKTRRYVVTAYLDQLNTFYTLLAPIAPPDFRADWLAETESIARQIPALFLHEPSQLFHLTGEKVKGANARPNADYGHAAKSHWFLMMAGALSGDAAMIEASRTGGKQVLNTSYKRESGAWSNGFGKNGKPANHRDAWVFAEQNQLLASLALSEPRLTGVLAETYGFWLDRFVDRQEGGVFDALDARGKPLRRGRPKHWAWKSGFHEFEHALVAYIATSEFEGKPLTLHYAFVERPAEGDLRPYLFNARLTSLQESGRGLQAANFDRVTFP